MTRHGLISCPKQAVVAQLVERVLGKDEVTGSIPVNGSMLLIAAIRGVQFAAQVRPLERN
jgi:hypothetical protein